MNYLTGFTTGLCIGRSSSSSFSSYNRYENEELKRKNNELIKKIEQLEQQREQAVTLIKDGRFIEALRVLENGN